MIFHSVTRYLQQNNEIFLIYKKVWKRRANTKICQSLRYPANGLILVYILKLFFVFINSRKNYTTPMKLYQFD